MKVGALILKRFTFMRKIVKIAAFFILSLACVSCQKNKSEGECVKTITLNLQEGDPPSLNPYVGVDLRSRCLYLTLFEPLMRRGREGQIELAAAQKVEIDPTQTIYTFHLRPHKWSNGEDVTAHQFADAWKYALKPISPCFRADLFYVIKNGEKVKKGELTEEHLGLHIPDPHTLIVTLEHPTPFFLDLTATSFYCPLYVASGQEPSCFNGPFIVKEWIPDQKFVLEKNGGYWDKDSLKVEEICFTMVKDPMTALAMFEKGELDLVGDPLSPLPFDTIPTLRESGALQNKTISRIFYLLINTESYPLQCASLRKALSAAIDREALTQHLFFGEIPTQAPLPTTLSYLENQTDGGDALQFFEQALEELNLTRESFPKIIFSYAELSGQKKLAEFLQSQWSQKLGIDVELLCNEWNVHSPNLRKGNYQIGTLHLTTLFQDPMFYFSLFRDKRDSCNYCRWENEEFRSLLEASEKTTDPVVRRDYLRRAEEKLMEEMPVMSLFTQNLQYMLDDGLDLSISDLGLYDFKYATFR